jgi:hypothetical protein
MRKSQFTGVLLALAAFSVLSVSAKAGTFDFTYSGTGPTTGSGSFTTNDSNDPAGIGDLSAFTLSITENDGTPGQNDIFTWGLGDLTAFDASYIGNTLTALSFTTCNTYSCLAPGNYTPNQYFEVTDLGVGDAGTFNPDIGQITVGTVTFQPASSVVPEPSSFALLGLGVASFLIFRSRRAQLAKCAASNPID